MIEHLPARVAPAPGESLDSWLDRTADHNDIPRRVLAAELQHLSGLVRAEILGTNWTNLRAMTLDRYPANVGGRQQTSWRVAHYHWVCHRCPPNAPKPLAWQLALHPVCQACGCYLTPRGTLPGLDADPAMLVRAQTLLRHADTGLRAGPGLARLRQVMTLLATSLDDDWPPRHIPVPPVPIDAIRRWGRRNSPDPLVAATLLSVTAEPADQTSLVQEGWRRAPLSLFMNRAQLPPWLPPHPRGTFGRAWNNTDRARLADLRAWLRARARTDGLGVRHLPTCLFLPREFPIPEASLRPQRATAATITAQLLPDHDAGSHDAPLLDAAGEAAMNAVDLGLGVSALHSRLIMRSVAGLFADGLIDYTDRRRLFGNPLRLPRDVRHLVGIHRARIDHPRPAEVAQAWLWLRFTRSPLTESPWPLLDSDHVLGLAEQLDPELRLSLDDLGRQHLALVANDIAYFQRPAPARRAAR